MSPDLEAPNSGSMLTPLEYTRYLKNSGRVTGEISHYTALDQYYAERGYPPVPENAPLVLRAAGGLSELPATRQRRLSPVYALFPGNHRRHCGLSRTPEPGNAFRDRKVF